MAKPQVDEAIDQDPHPPPRGSDAFYPAALPLSSQVLNYATLGIPHCIRRVGYEFQQGGNEMLVLNATH
jgi:hypothetical protein